MEVGRTVLKPYIIRGAKQPVAIRKPGGGGFLQWRVPFKHSCSIGAIAPGENAGCAKARPGRKAPVDTGSTPVSGCVHALRPKIRIFPTRI